MSSDPKGGGVEPAGPDRSDPVPAGREHSGAVAAGPVPTGPVAAGSGPSGRVRIVAPLTVEALAVGGTRIGLRARRPLPPGPLLLAGVAGAVAPDLRPGDIVVADCLLLPLPSHRANVIDDHVCARLVGAAELAERLRVAGLTVYVGAVGGAGGVVTGAARADWAARGALAVDMESAALAPTGRLVAVVRAIVDTPVHPLVSLGTLPRGIAALRALRRAAPVLSAWAGGRGGPDVRERQAAHAEALVTLPGEVENS